MAIISQWYIYQLDSLRESPDIYRSAKQREIYNSLVRKDFVVFFFLAVIAAAVYYKSFFTFFAQDDFILINQFSQNSLLVDIKGAFGPPQVTHWRPVHSLYFVLSGNLFGKSYFWYHLLTFIFHVGAGFFVYKTAFKILVKTTPALVSAVIYVVHPAHFVSLFWISGGATTLGFFFLLFSFYCYLYNRQRLSLLLFVVSVLASEAMAVGAILFLSCDLLIKKRFNFSFFWYLGIGGGLNMLKLFLFTSKEGMDAYKIYFSIKVLGAAKYYLLRTFGFAEVSPDRILSFVNALILTGTAAMLWFSRKRINRSLLTFFLTILLAGLFPFVLISEKLSPHYMNISIFGFALLISYALRDTKKIGWFLVFALCIASMFAVNLTYQNNWVITRSLLAKSYLSQIEKTSLGWGSTIVLDENAYYALGGQEASRFWFADKNYRFCFEKFEKCNNLD